MEPILVNVTIYVSFTYNLHTLERSIHMEEQVTLNKHTYFKYLRENFGGENLLGLDIVAFMAYRYEQGMSVADLCDLYQEHSGKDYYAGEAIKQTARRYLRFMESKATKDELAELFSYDFTERIKHLELRYFIPKLHYKIAER